MLLDSYVCVCVFVRVEVCAVTCSAASAAHTPAGAEGAGAVCQYPHQHADGQHTRHGQSNPKTLLLETFHSVYFILCISFFFCSIYWLVFIVLY